MTTYQNDVDYQIDGIIADLAQFKRARRRGERDGQLANLKQIRDKLDIVLDNL